MLCLQTRYLGDISAQASFGCLLDDTSKCAVNPSAPSERLGPVDWWDVSQVPAIYDYPNELPNIRTLPPITTMAAGGRVDAAVQGLATWQVRRRAAGDRLLEALAAAVPSGAEIAPR